MKLFSFPVLIFFVFLCACSNPSQTVRIIPLGDNVTRFAPVKLSRIATSLRYIPLETSDSTLLGRVFNEGARYHKGNFYIVDNLGQRCQVYDGNGKYLRSLGKAGRAAGEYPKIMTPMHFNIHPSSGNFEVYTENKYVIYDNRGNFLSEFPVPEVLQEQGYRLGRIICLPAGGYFATLFNMKKDTWDYTFLNPDGTLAEKEKFGRKTSEPYREPVETEGGPIAFKVIVIPDAYPLGEGLRLVTPEKDTLYTIGTDRKKSLAYILDKGTYKNEPGALNGAPSLNVYGLKETENFLLFTCAFLKIDKPGSLEKNNPRAWFDKKEGTLTFLSKGGNGEYGFINDLDDGADFWPDYITPDGRMMLSVMEAHKFIQAAARSGSKKMKETAAALTEESNPVIIAADLK